MKKITLNLLIVVFTIVSVHAQNTSKLKAEEYLSTKGELTFTFQVENHNEVDLYTRSLSIVNYDPNTKTVIAWANENQFRAFEARNIAYQVPENENEVDEAVIYDNPQFTLRSTQATTLTFPLTTYPTYAQYEQQMLAFQASYPGIVQTFSIGKTTENDKDLLFVKISDNVGADEQEPKLLYTSSMHGDEIAGYPMMLSLIDYILTTYTTGVDGDPEYERVKNLVENAEIWINPSANPDGTYKGSADNTSVSGAIRGNTNSIDLNRNYPDNVAGPHDDGEAYQVETLAFMNLAETNHFVIAANFHGGVECVNYPFDNARTNQYTHADTDWFEFISVEYATHAQNDSDAAPYNNTTYMTLDYDWDASGGLYPNNYIESPGVTHGAEWYRVYGGRQDYMNFYHQCREVTVELSDTKIIPESQLDDHWYYNKNALLDYLTQGTYGFRGVVKDASTGNPIENATVTLVGHDAYGSHTVTDITFGDYYRPVKAGTYTIMFEADCYQSFELTDQTINDGLTIVLSDVNLTPIASTPPANITVSNLLDTTATISWDAITGANYDYQYKETSSTTWLPLVNTSNNSIDLTGLTAETEYEVQVRSTCNSNTSSWSTSEIFTTTAPPPCDPPSNITVSNVAPTSATLSWNAIAGANFDYRYQEVLSPGWITVNTSNNSESITGLTPEIEYEVQVRTNCNSNSSLYSTPTIKFTTPPISYCSSTSSDSSSEHISRVQINTINKTSGASNYTDYTNLSTDLTQNTQYTITITATKSNSNTRERFAVWIDYNKDGNFVDSEKILNVASKNLSISRTITIPSNITFGTTRMRVSMKQNASPTSCESFVRGEVEDYSVYLTYDGLMYSDNKWTPNAPDSATGTDNVLVLNGTYTLVDENVMVNNIEVANSANLSIPETSSLTVNGDLTGNNNIILESISNNYSSLVVNGTVTGDVKYKRFVNAFTGSGGNDLISAPVVGQSFGDFASVNPNIFENPAIGFTNQKLFGPFNKTTDWYQIYDSSADADIILNSGVGYRAARDATEDVTSGKTFTFTGSVNTGSVDISILNQGTAYPEWNLIGNPFPSYIKLDEFLAANNDFLDANSAGIYGYNGNSNGWEIWNQIYSDLNPGALITPGQGFLVASQTGGATISFTSGMRSIGNTDDFIANKNSSISHLKLKVTNSSEMYATDFYFTDNASLGLDPGYDASVFGDIAPSSAIYSQLVNDNQGIDMAIQSVSNTDLNNNVVIPLGINANQGQQLTVSIVNTTLPENTNVYLEDNIVNTTTLLNANDYVFTPDTNLNDVGRFYLRFETETLSTIENELNDLVIYNTTSPKVLYVKGQITDLATLYLYDIHGRIVLTEQLKPNTNSQQIDLSNIGIGVYIAKIDSYNISKVKKLIIR